EAPGVVVSFHAEETTMKRFYLCLSLMLVLAGCGSGGGSYSPSKTADSNYYGSPSGGGAQPTAQSYSESSADYSSTPNAPPPVSASRESTTVTGSGGAAQHDQRMPEPRPQERPGLGTEWGESRTSRVHDVTFVRGDADRPF